MSNNEEVLENFSEVIQQYREENSFSSSNDIFFGSNSNNNNYNKGNLCIQCKSVHAHPDYWGFCGPICRDKHKSERIGRLKIIDA